jgi:hypothetical protein
MDLIVIYLKYLSGLSPSTFTEDRDRSSDLNVMALQCSVLIRKWIKFNWSATIVDRIRACEGVGSTFINFKKHNCIQDIEIVILLRDKNS